MTNGKISVVEGGGEPLPIDSSIPVGARAPHWAQVPMKVPVLGGGMALDKQQLIAIMQRYFEGEITKADVLRNLGAYFDQVSTEKLPSGAVMSGRPTWERGKEIPVSGAVMSQRPVFRKPEITVSGAEYATGYRRPPEIDIPVSGAVMSGRPEFGKSEITAPSWDIVGKGPGVTIPRSFTGNDRFALNIAPLNGGYPPPPPRQEFGLLGEEETSRGGPGELMHPFFGGRRKRKRGVSGGGPFGQGLIRMV